MYVCMYVCHWTWHLHTFASHNLCCMCNFAHEIAVSQVFGSMSIGQPSHAVFANWVYHGLPSCVLPHVRRSLVFLMVCLLLVSCAEKCKCSMHLDDSGAYRPFGALEPTRSVDGWWFETEEHCHHFVSSLKQGRRCQVFRALVLGASRSSQGILRYFKYFNRSQDRYCGTSYIVKYYINNILSDQTISQRRCISTIFQRDELRKSRKCRTWTSSNILQYHQYQILSAWCSLVQSLRRCKAKVQAAGGKALESAAWEAPELPDAAWTNSVNKKARAPWGFTHNIIHS